MLRTTNAMEALRLKLAGLGLSTDEVSDALALVTPKERVQHTALTLPGKRLASVANAVTDGILADAASMARSDVMPKAALRNAERFGDDASTATVVERLERGITDGSVPKTVTSKQGKVAPSPAVKALSRIKGICALTDD